MKFQEKWFFPSFVEVAIILLIYLSCHFVSHNISQKRCSFLVLSNLNVFVFPETLNVILSCVMLKNGQTYFKNLTVATL